MAEPPALAIVGGETLLGNDLREVLSESILGTNLKLAGSVEEASVAILSEQSGEPVVLTAVDEETLSEARIVFFAGTAESTRKALTRMGKAHPLLIDLTYALDDRPEARLRAPSAEPPGAVAGISPISVIAHPAAIVLGTFCRRLHAAFPVQRSVAQIFAPASEQGRGGIDELQQQTVDLLSFRPAAKRLFDAQLSFNVLARYGEEAPIGLEATELRIEKHLATLLAHQQPVPMPSVRVVQVPVMHGYSISLWAELGTSAPVAEIRAALAGNGIDVAAANMSPPDVLSVAGQSGISAGAIEADRNNSRAVWCWIVADNYLVSAENAVAVARSALLERTAPEGGAD
jgi:aspartate-semialdehyde dehydrogenase